MEWQVLIEKGGRERKGWGQEADLELLAWGGVEASGFKLLLGGGTCLAFKIRTKGIIWNCWNAQLTLSIHPPTLGVYSHRSWEMILWRKREY